MTKNEIIEQWAKAKVVEDIAKHYNVDCREDLCQMIYLDLLQKDETIIQELYENNQYMFFISRMIVNQIVSYKSPFYMKVLRFTYENARMDDHSFKLSVDDDRTRQELIERIYDEIDALPDDLRRILLLYSDSNFDDMKEIFKNHNIKSSGTQYKKLKELLLTIQNNIITGKRDTCEYMLINKCGKEQEKNVKRKQKKVFAYGPGMEFIGEYENAHIAGKELGINTQSIWKSARYGKPTKGLWFKYEKIN